jgi:6-phosphogluconolactonase
MTPADLSVFEDPDALALAAAEEFVARAKRAIAERGRFLVALSGGSTPKKMHALLADQLRSEVDWTQVFVFFGDERFVPPTDPESNERMARLTLLSHVPIPAGQIYPMYRPVEPDAAATMYEEIVRDLRMDLTFLGLGPDGHTASLFPGRPAVHETERLVIAAAANAGVGERITMTPPMLNRSRRILFLVAGYDKAAPLQRVLNGAEDWDQTPAQAVARHGEDVAIFADKHATS